MLNMRLQYNMVLSTFSIVNLIDFSTGVKMKIVWSRDRKLEFIKASLFRSFHGTKAPTAFYCFTFICGRAYHRQEQWDF